MTQHITLTSTVDVAHAGRETQHGPARASCSGCPARWPLGGNASHCPTCHETWRSSAGFDAHRTGGRCRIAEEIQALGYQRNGNGMWRIPRAEYAEWEPDVNGFVPRGMG